ncbi:MAG: gamma-glutamyl-gamma-aminobutyrate hydrolase family protein [Verrucomicrobia bacterium]|nr:gamma-glutamyl-gamma-aminobutyrate hydrolase family protein [Verrucomicrobiota bacterium]
MKQPLIAVTPDVNVTKNGRLQALLSKSYTDAILAAGGLPMVLPLTEDEAALAALAARADGLLLSGGGDVAPEFYGGDAGDTAARSISRVRDAMEIFLVRHFLREGRRPLLGICRGCQVMNVALGGTLVADVPRDSGLGVDHFPPNPYEVAHEVSLEVGSRLTAITGATTLEVNSSHHQAVQACAPKLRVVARSTRDGVIEAIEADGSQWVIGVQWHPERLHDRLPHAAALFRALVDAAR